MSEWIKCSDRMPEFAERVLVYAKDGVHGGNEIDIEYLFYEGVWKDQGLFCTITHWMSLPQPPKDN